MGYSSLFCFCFLFSLAFFWYRIFGLNGHSLGSSFLVWLVSLLVPVLPVGLCHVATLASHNVYNCLHLFMTLHAVALRHGVTSGL